MQTYRTSVNFNVNQGGQATCSIFKMGSPTPMAPGSMEPGRHCGVTPSVPSKCVVGFSLSVCLSVVVCFSFCDKKTGGITGGRVVAGTQ